MANKKLVTRKILLVAHTGKGTILGEGDLITGSLGGRGLDEGEADEGAVAAAAGVSIGGVDPRVVRPRLGAARRCHQEPEEQGKKGPGTHGPPPFSSSSSPGTGRGMDLESGEGEGIAEVAKARKELIRGGGRASASAAGWQWLLTKERKGSKPLPEIRRCDAICYYCSWFSVNAEVLLGAALLRLGGKASRMLRPACGRKKKKVWDGLTVELGRGGVVKSSAQLSSGKL